MYFNFIKKSKIKNSTFSIQNLIIYFIRTITSIGAFLFFPLLSAQSPYCASHWNDSVEVIQENKVLSIQSQEINSRESITIPVVVHILWKEDEQNISDEQVHSQIEVLNKAFQARPDNIDIIPTHFQDLIANIDLDFCLAQRSPQGHTTNGIVRTRTTINIFNSNANLLFNSDLGGSDIWNPNEYLNIYVANLAENINGRGIFPSEASATMDGVIINYRYFGNTGTALDYPAYNLGNTCVHEVGHYLNLQHIWGSELGLCSLDDGINDTPRQNISYLGECPNDTRNTCDSRDMYMNYMNYTNDACLAMFTPQQKERMLATLNGTRASLKNSNGCKTVSNIQSSNFTGINIYPTLLSNQELLKIHLPSLFPKTQLRLFALNGQIVTSTVFFSQKEYQWQLPELAKGIYFLQVKVQEKWIFEKIVIF